MQAEKRQVRARCLREVRQWVRAQPAACMRQSQRICDELYTLYDTQAKLHSSAVQATAVAAVTHTTVTGVMATANNTHTHAGDACNDDNNTMQQCAHCGAHTTTCATGAVDNMGNCDDARPTDEAPLYLLVYYPLYYEVDVMPFVERVLREYAEATRALRAPGHPSTTQSRARRSRRATCVMLPVVLDPHVNDAIAAMGVAAVAEHTASSATADERHGDVSAAASRLRAAMLFVEVFDVDDLAASFVPSGAYKLHELSRQQLAQLFVRHTADSTCANENKENGVSGDGQHDRRCSNCCSTAAVTSHAQSGACAQLRDEATSENKSCRCNNVKSTMRPRRVVACDSWQRLFPGYRDPPGLVQWVRTHPPCDSIRHIAQDEQRCQQQQQQLKRHATEQCGQYYMQHMLVITPGVGFCVHNGARLGKGGGYYDRFLRYQTKQMQSSTQLCVQGDNAACRAHCNVTVDDSTNTTTTATQCSVSQKCDAAPQTVNTLHLVGACFDMQLCVHDATQQVVGAGKQHNDIGTATAAAAELHCSHTCRKIPHDEAVDVSMHSLATSAYGVVHVTPAAHRAAPHGNSNA